jgi:hypothetical protein
VELPHNILNRSAVVLVNSQYNGTVDFTCNLDWIGDVKILGKIIFRGGVGVLFNKKAALVRWRILSLASGHTATGVKGPLSGFPRRIIAQHTPLSMRHCNGSQLWQNALGVVAPANCCQNKFSESAGRLFFKSSTNRNATGFVLGSGSFCSIFVSYQTHSRTSRIFL